MFVKGECEAEKTWNMSHEKRLASEGRKAGFERLVKVNGSYPCGLRNALKMSSDLLLETSGGGSS